MLFSPCCKIARDYAGRVGDAFSALQHLIELGNVREAQTLRLAGWSEGLDDDFEVAATAAARLDGEAGL